MKMAEKKSTTATKKLKNEKIKTSASTKKEKDLKIIRTAEILSNATLLPTTINYNSDILPDAIFLTTSSGQLITTPSVNQTLPTAPTFLSEKQQNDENTTTTASTCSDEDVDNKSKTKKEKTEDITLEEEDEEDAAASEDNTEKPSALETTNTDESSATQTTILQQQTQQSPAKSNLVSKPSSTATAALSTSHNQKEQKATTFTANFPIIAPGLTAAGNLTGFTTAQTNLTAFSLPNSFLTGTGLTIPLYNSFVAVSPATKDAVLPTLTKDLFSTPAAVPRAKGSGSKTKNNISQNGNGMTTSRGRKRTAQSRLPAKLKEPAAVARRNARERRRVKMVNDGFLRLRRHVPTDPKNKKLSKVKTLRLAIEYIHHLQQLLQSDSSKQTPSSIVTSFTQVTNSYDDIDDPEDNGWLHTDSLVSFALKNIIF